MHTKEELEACSAYLGRIGHALADALKVTMAKSFNFNLEHDKHIRYFARAPLAVANNKAKFVRGRAEGIGPTSDELHATPAEALQLCEDGTLSVGIAVLEPSPNQGRSSLGCAGVEFTINRVADGEHFAVSQISTFQAACNDLFRDEVVKKLGVVKTVR